MNRKRGGKRAIDRYIEIKIEMEIGIGIAGTRRRAERVAKAQMRIGIIIDIQIEK